MISVHGVMNNLIFTVWFVLLLQTGVYSVSITELRVPSFVKNGTKAAILDCVYSLRTEEQTSDSGLVVKWFFNSPSPVYQWIHNQKPQGLGILKNRLQLDYRASDNNATVYRALYIINPTVELSGEYKCLVSTNIDEDFSVKRMTVWAPEKQLELFHTRYDMETINITCRAIGIYPEPDIVLYNDTTMFNDVVVISTKKINAYDVTAYVLIPDTELPSPTAIDCSLQLPNIPYTSRKTMHYYPGSTESLSSVSDCAVCTRKSTIVFLLLVLFFPEFSIV